MCWHLQQTVSMCHILLQFLVFYWIKSPFTLYWYAEVTACGGQHQTKKATNAEMSFPARACGGNFYRPVNDKVTSKNPQKFRQIEAFSIIGQILTCKQCSEIVTLPWSLPFSWKRAQLSHIRQRLVLSNCTCKSYIPDWWSGTLSQRFIPRNLIKLILSLIWYSVWSSDRLYSRCNTSILNIITTSYGSLFFFFIGVFRGCHNVDVLYLVP